MTDLKILEVPDLRRQELHRDRASPDCRCQDGESDKLLTDFKKLLVFDLHGLACRKQVCEVGPQSFVSVAWLSEDIGKGADELELYLRMRSRDDALDVALVVSECAFSKDPLLLSRHRERVSRCQRAITTISAFGDRKRASYDCSG